MFIGIHKMNKKNHIKLSDMELEFLKRYFIPAREADEEILRRERNEKLEKLLLQ